MRIWLISLISGLFVLAGFLSAPYLGDTRFLVVSQLAMIMFAMPILYGVYKCYPRLLGAFGLLGLYGLGIESLSVLTSFPYGYFEYGSGFGYKLFGVVPWTVFLVWPTLVFGAYALSRGEMMRFVVGLLLFDLLFDPLAVAVGMWSWITTGPYFSVPWVNFGGWIFSAVLSYWLLRLYAQKSAFKAARLVIQLPLILMTLFWTGVAIYFAYWLPLMFGLVLLAFSCWQNWEHLRISR